MLILKKFKNPAYIIIILIFTFVFLLALSSCQPNIENVSTEIELDSGEPGILAENKAVDFYFYYPENWILDKNAAMISIYVNDPEVLAMDTTAPDSGDNIPTMIKPNLSAWAVGLPNGMYKTVEEYWENLVVPSRGEIFKDIVNEPAEGLTVDGIPAQKYIYTFSSAGVKYKIAEVVFFKGRQVYTLTYTSAEDRFDKYSAVLDTAAETFKFK